MHCRPHLRNNSKLVLAIAITLVACQPGTLKSWVKKNAAGFGVIEPVSQFDERGAVLANNQAAANACFKGVARGDEQVDQSWSQAALSDALEYSGDIDASLGKDFGGLITVKAGAAKSFNGSLTLKNIYDLRLAEVYFDAQSTCAQDLARAEKSGVTSYEVITRLLKAQEIDIAAKDGSASNLEVSAGSKGGKLVAAGASVQTLKGGNVYFARFTEKLQVLSDTDTGSAESDGEFNSTVTNCTVKIQGWNPIKQRYKAKISFRDGKTIELPEADNGLWTAYSNIGSGGVSWAIRVKRAQPTKGPYQIEIVRYAVRKL